MRRRSGAAKVLPWKTPICTRNFDLKNTNINLLHLGETINVRITATLNGEPADTLLVQYHISIDSCSILHSDNDSVNKIEIISNGIVPIIDGPPFPVKIEHNPGIIGRGVDLNYEGVAFSFQVFTFGPGSTFHLR